VEKCSSRSSGAVIVCVDIVLEVEHLRQWMQRTIEGAIWKSCSPAPAGEVLVRNALGKRGQS